MPTTRAARKALTGQPLHTLLQAPGTVLLESPRRDPDSGDTGGLLFADPRRTLRARTYAEVPVLLDALDEALAKGHHVAGYLAYEAGYALEPDLFPDPPEPEGLLGWFGVYRAPKTVSARNVREGVRRAGAFWSGPPEFSLAYEAYAERLHAIKGLIREGEVYQINLTAPFTFDFQGDPLGFYSDLRDQQAVKYGAYIAPGGDGPRAICSVSPELFFRVDGDTITARPMKGTAPRAEAFMEDDRLAFALTQDEKSRAENLMIVDLIRNDLARVAVEGSVHVPRLFAAEKYRTLTQMTSTVQATRRPDATLGDLFRALFPCGSVTGAPRLRAMQHIRSLEGRPRGPYCGAIGHAGPDGSAAFSVAIRTAVVSGSGTDSKGRYDVGSGIVWDSEPEAEYAECLLKARVLTEL